MASVPPSICSSNSTGNAHEPAFTAQHTLMGYRVGADAVLIAHFAFMAFVVVGGLVVRRKRWLMAFHLPAVAWAAFVVASGRICPLTFVENALRVLAGEQGYGESFIEHYLLHVIYPPGLTPSIQIGLALGVVMVNNAIYARIFADRRTAPARS